ncbi:P44/Msp2 family outer membrane protein [Candidatus Mesenet endosymbiont of Agriotes lineatus]|uniref:P44/Msp2 family outer membrane protein n=1 Tax=Candidatus Mesenet endosymbiont of Agriotes lineatus TaxID=3077948 RepID=UPI0030D4FF3B
MLRSIFVLMILFFCSSAYCAENNLKSFYFKGSYFGAYGNNIGDFSGKEEAGNITKKVMSFNSDEELVEGYEPKYTPGFAGGGAIGYQLNTSRLPFMLSLLLPSRIELEGLYSQLNLDDEEYGDKDKAGYVELVRSSSAAAGTNCDSKWKTATSSSCTLQSTTQQVKRWPLPWGGQQQAGFNAVNHTSLNFTGAKAVFKIKDEGFHNRAMLMNVYYALNTNPYIVPYVGGGLGLTKIKFLGKSYYAPAYQLKLGAQYTFTEKAQIFVGLRRFGIFYDEFNNILPTTKIPVGDAGILNNVIINSQFHENYHYNHTTRVASTTATVTHKFSVYGLEVGMVYNF